VFLAIIAPMAPSLPNNTHVHQGPTLTKFSGNQYQNVHLVHLGNSARIVVMRFGQEIVKQVLFVLVGHIPRLQQMEFMERFAPKGAIVLRELMPPYLVTLVHMVPPHNSGHSLNVRVVNLEATAAQMV